MMQVPLHVAKVLSLAISLLCSLLTVPLSVAYGRQLAGQWAALLQDWAFLGGLQPVISPELQQRYRPAFLPSPPLAVLPRVGEPMARAAPAALLALAMFAAKGEPEQASCTPLPAVAAPQADGTAAVRLLLLWCNVGDEQMQEVTVNSHF